MRIGLLIIAIAAALFGTILIAIYISRITQQVTAGQKTVQVYVAQRHVAKDTPATELLRRDLIKKVGIPRKYLAAGAVSSLKGLRGKILLAPLDRGEQLTSSVLALPPSGLMTPKDKLAVNVPVSNTALINGAVSAGDYVTVFAVLIPGKDNKDTTRIVLSRVLVLSAQKPGKNQSGDQSGKGSLTLAVSPSDAEKLVFVSTLPPEKGTMWIGLWAPGAKSLSPTEGQNVDSLF